MTLTREQIEEVYRRLTGYGQGAAMHHELRALRDMALRYAYLRMHTSGSPHHNERWVDFHFTESMVAHDSRETRLLQLVEHSALALDAAIDAALKGKDT